MHPQRIAVVALLATLSSAAIPGGPVARIASASIAHSSPSVGRPVLVAAAPVAPARPMKGSFRRMLAAKALSGWGVLFLVSLLANTIKRLLPIALEPLLNKDLSPAQSFAYMACCAIMTYVEGYRAFHLKFVPLVVARSLALIDHPSFLNYLFAGPFSMGLFYSTRKRKIISWSVTTGVFAIVMVVKRLPYPWRAIVDAGARNEHPALASLI